MKKVLICALAVGLAATAADASIFRLNFVGGGNAATVQQGGPAVGIEIWLDVKQAGPGISGVGFEFEALPAIVQTGRTANLGGALGGFDGPLGATAVYNIGWGGTAGPGPATGSYLLGTLSVAAPLATATGAYELVINHNSVSVLDDTGGALAFDARPGYSDTYGSTVAYGNWGGPAWSAKGKGSQLRNPLFLNVEVPEPTSLVLLALGGIAAIRRR